MNRYILFLVTTLMFPVAIWSQEAYRLLEDIAYTEARGTDSYRLERCKLDIYYPENKTGYPTVIWFHGGALEYGHKKVPEELKEKGMAVVAVNYRLSPQVTAPAYLDDAALAVSWVFKQIASYGGSTSDIYLSGHSAGAYLALMLGMDDSYLNTYGLNSAKIKGIAPISSQTFTHYTLRKENGLPEKIPTLDKYAPLHHIRKETTPLLLFTGDRHLDIAARHEENLYFLAVMKAAGNKQITYYEIPGFDHLTVCVPAFYLMVDWIKKLSKIE